MAAEHPGRTWGTPLVWHHSSPDGFFEATAPDGKTEFGIDRLREAVGSSCPSLSLEACMNEASAAVRKFTGKDELQDDQTLLLLRT